MTQAAVPKGAWMPCKNVTCQCYACPRNWSKVTNYNIHWYHWISSLDKIQIHYSYSVHISITVKCCYNTVQYNMMLHALLQWIMQNINQGRNTQRHHITRSNGQAVGCLVRILEKIVHFITAPYCIGNFVCCVCFIYHWNILSICYLNI